VLDNETTYCDNKDLDRKFSNLLAVLSSINEKKLVKISAAVHSAYYYNFNGFFSA
jgi:hypothetical protein